MKKNDVFRFFLFIRINGTYKKKKFLKKYVYSDAIFNLNSIETCRKTAQPPAYTPAAVDPVAKHIRRLFFFVFYEPLNGDGGFEWGGFSCGAQRTFLVGNAARTLVHSPPPSAVTRTRSTTSAPFPPVTAPARRRYALYL